MRNVYVVLVTFATFVVFFGGMWIASSGVSAGATHKPFLQCLASTRLDCE